MMRKLGLRSRVPRFFLLTGALLITVPGFCKNNKEILELASLAMSHNMK